MKNMSTHTHTPGGFSCSRSTSFEDDGSKRRKLYSPIQAGECRGKPLGCVEGVCNVSSQPKSKPLSPPTGQSKRRPHHSHLHAHRLQPLVDVPALCPVPGVARGRGNGIDVLYPISQKVVPRKGGGKGFAPKVRAPRWRNDATSRRDSCHPNIGCLASGN